MRTSVFLSSILVAATAVAGCQSYRPDPPDLEAHARAWSTRGADAGGVREYAASLARLNVGERVPLDLQDGLTLAEAETVALFLNPDLRIARARARVPALAAREAGRPEDPELDIDLLRILEGVSSPWILGTGLTFSIPLSGRLQAERAEALARADVARCEAWVAEQSVLRQLREAWNRWSATGERVALMERHLEDVARILGIARAQRSADQIGAPQLRVLELEDVREQGELERLRAEHRRGEVALKRLMGLAPEAELALVPGFSAEMPAAGPAEERMQLREQNAELVLAKARYLAAERTLRLETKKQLPDLGLGPRYENEDAQGRLGAGATIPIPLWNRNRRAIAEARAARDAARGAYLARYETLVGDLAEARLDQQAAASQRAWLHDRVAPLADQQLAEVRKLGELGDMDVLILRDALTGVLETKVRLLEVRLDEAQASVAVQALIDPLRTPSTCCTAK